MLGVFLNVIKTNVVGIKDEVLNSMLLQFVGNP